MEKLIAKRYVKALLIGVSEGDLRLYLSIFEAFNTIFKNSDLKEFINSSFIDSSSKKELLFDVLTRFEIDDKVKNLINVLVDNKRASIIPFMYEELRLHFSKRSGVYEAVLCSNYNIKDSMLKEYENALGKRLGVDVRLKRAINESCNGIRIDVKDLGIEISFSKDRVKSMMIEHVLKVI